MKKILLLLTLIQTALFPGDGKNSIVELISLSGRAQYQASGGGQWRGFTYKTPFLKGMTVRLAPNARAVMRFKKNITVRIMNGAVIRLADTAHTSGAVRVVLPTGDLRGYVKTGSEDSLMVQTQNALISAESGKGKEFLTESGRYQTKVIALLGEIGVSTPDFSTSRTVSAGNFVTVSGEYNSITEPEAITPEIFKAWNIPTALTEKKHRDLVLEGENPGGWKSTYTDPNQDIEVTAPGEKQRKKTDTNFSSNRVDDHTNRQKATPDIKDWKFSFSNQISAGYYQSEASAGYQMEINLLSFHYKGAENFKHWLTFNWMPEFYWGPFGIGFFFPFYLGLRHEWFLPKNWYNAEDYNFETSGADVILNKIVFFQAQIWRLFFRIGSIPSLTFGSGYFLDDYSNMPDFPVERKTGLILGFNFKKAGGQVKWFSGDLTGKYLYGIRAKLHPFQFSKLENRFLRRIETGYNLVWSTTPLKDLITSGTYYTLSQSQHSITGQGIDIIAPLGKRRNTTLYINFGSMTLRTNQTPVRYGPGFSTGAKGRLLFLDWLGEFYFSKQGFLPSYFDSFYYYSDSRKEKFISCLTNRNDNLGLRVKADFNLGKALVLKALYGSWHDTKTFVMVDNKIEASLTIQEGVLKKVHGSIFYKRRHILSFSEITENPLNENTLTGAEIYFKLFKYADLLIDVKVLEDENEKPELKVKADIIFKLPGYSQEKNTEQKP